MKCILIDDEPLALELLESHIARFDQIEIVGKYNSAVEAFAHVPRLKPDLLFLDIQMPQLTGLDFLRALPNPPIVIITTAFREYALDGFDLNVLDYLLKPVAYPRFLKAIAKAFEQHGKTLNMVGQPDESLTEHQSKAEDDFIYLKVDKMMEKVMLQDILYVESLKNYVRVKTIQNELITYHTLSQMEEKLPVGQFLRIHRSFLIALNKIESYSSTEVKVRGKQIPVGGNYKDTFISKVGKG